MDRVTDLQSEPYNLWLADQEKNNNPIKTRLCFLLDLETLGIEPELRTTEDDMSFTRVDKTDALDYSLNLLEEITSHDRRWLKILDTEYVDGGLSCVLKGLVAVRSLCGYPYVFDAKEPDRRIKIVDRVLKIKVSRREDGIFCITTNVDPACVKAGDTIFVRDTGDGIVEVTSATEAQLEFLKRFFSSSSEAVLPVQAQSKLKTLLNMLQVDAEVETDFSLG